MSFGFLALTHISEINWPAIISILSAPRLMYLCLAGTSLFTRYSFDDNPFTEEDQEEEGEDVIEYGEVTEPLSHHSRLAYLMVRMGRL